VADIHGDLEALLAEAHRRAEQRALEREAAAARRAEEVLHAADEAATHALDERRAYSRAQAEALRERLLALGEMAGQRLMLGRREALLDAVWDAASARLSACADAPDRYLPALRSLARLGAQMLAADEIELASDARGHALLLPDRLADWGREDGVRYRRADAPIAISGGLEARAGRLRFDGSFETRLEQARSALREEVAAWLLPEPERAGVPREGSVQG